MIFMSLKNGLAKSGKVCAAVLAMALILLMGTGVMEAQKRQTQVLDPSLIKAPAGARVAILEFYDLECPACAHANPTVRNAAAKYKIPLVRYDFLIPNHIWSPTAALNARWFDTKSKGLGDLYRDEVFANQRSIYNLDALRDFTNKFAQSHGVAMPFALDPQGKLEAAIQKDGEIGKRIGINSTPTIFIAITNSKGAPYLEVLDPDKDLYSTIDQALAMAGPAPAVLPVKKTASK